MTGARYASALAAGVTLVLGIAAAGCAGRDPAAGARSGRKILRVAYEREIDVLNPFTSQNLVDISFSMIEGLVTTDDQNRYVPVLATAIPTEDNGLIRHRPDGTVEMTWPLHEGVRWHDGAPFTSRDVCFTWRFVTSPGSLTYNREQYLGIKECRNPDDHTVVFVWDGEYAYYAGLFEAILPEHVLGRMTTDEIVNYEPYNRGAATVGTGPFKFAEWEAGEYIRVVRNDDYWRGKAYPGIDEIVWAFIPDANTRLLALRSGRYDWGRIEPMQVPLARSLPRHVLHLVDSNSAMHLDLGIKTEHGRRLFDDVRVRRALFHAIDRRAIADKLMGGTVKVTDSPLNPRSPYHDPDVPSYDMDPDRARRLLDEAGWTAGPDGVRRKGGERFSFTLLNRSGSADRMLVAQVIQAQLRAVGVEVLFETLESVAWSSRWRRGQWEAVVSAWFLPADPTLTGLYACDGANNMTGFCDPVLDDLLVRSDHALSLTGRKPLLDRAQERLAETARTLPLFHNATPELVSRRVVGYRGSGTNFGSFWNLYDWTLTGDARVASTSTN
jgi:peptide/nickel transport system substrate-binding protein